MLLTVTWIVMSWSLIGICWSFGRMCCLHVDDMKLECAVCSKASVNIYQSTWWYTPGNSHLHNCTHQNVRSQCDDVQGLGTAICHINLPTLYTVWLTHGKNSLVPYTLWKECNLDNKGLPVNAILYMYPQAKTSHFCISLWEWHGTCAHFLWACKFIPQNFLRI
jgi:hypothetical protein